MNRLDYDERITIIYGKALDGTIRFWRLMERQGIPAIPGKEIVGFMFINDSGVITEAVYTPPGIPADQITQLRELLDDCRDLLRSGWKHANEKR